jgi:hypothetical protein
VESGVKSDKAEKKPDLSAELDLVKGQFEDFVEATDAMRKLGQK